MSSRARGRGKGKQTMGRGSRGIDEHSYHSAPMMRSSTEEYPSGHSGYSASGGECGTEEDSTRHSTSCAAAGHHGTNGDPSINSRDSTEAPPPRRGCNKLAPPPKNPEDRPLLVIEGDRAFSGCDYYPKILSGIIRMFMPGHVPTWKHYPDSWKTMCYEEFEKYYKFRPSEMTRARNVLHAIAQTRYSDMLSKLRQKATEKLGSDKLKWKGWSEHWMRQDHWDSLCNIWADKKWKNRSKVASKNRNSSKDDKVHHSCVSIKINVHKKRMAIELGRNPTLKEVFDRTHKSKKTGAFVSKRARTVSDAYDQSIREKYGDDVSSQPELDSQAWLSASGGASKGRIYGFDGSVNSRSILGGMSYHESEAPISSNASQTVIDDAFMMRLREMMVEVATEVATKVFMQMRQADQSTSQPSSLIPSSTIPPFGPTSSSRASTERDVDDDQNIDGGAKD